MKSKGIAVLLAIFLGGLGIHKFYLDKPGIGLVYLLFCWTFVPAVLGFVDAIIIICTPNSKWKERYGA